MKHVPEVEQEAKAMLEEKEEEAPRASLAKPPAKKKNKPMSKSEQERKIEELTKINSAFERQASGSQEPMPSEPASFL
jgi:bromodomain-containing factor 1